MSAEQAIVDSSRLEQIRECIAEAGVFAFDLEFVSSDRYIPDLCLVQLCWPEAEPVAIDPLAVDITPILELVAAPEIATVAHAAKQDLQLIATRHQCAAANFVDTQIAAAFCGLGDQVGLARLVEDLEGLKLDKGSQFTDWSRRPLSRSQMRYALDDVRYLLSIWSELSRRLTASGRLEWVRDESAELAAACAVVAEPEDAYLRVSGARGLTGSALASLRSLAAWRETEARQKNKPPAWLIPDKAMVEAARRGVKKVGDLRRLRGLPNGSIRSYGEDIVGALIRGRSEKVPVVQPRPQPDGAESLQISVLNSVIQAESRRQNMSPRFVGTKADVEDLINWFHSGAEGDGSELRLLGTWRREFIGETALRWLRGEESIVADDTAGLAWGPDSVG